LHLILITVYYKGHFFIVYVAIEIIYFYYCYYSLIYSS